MENDEFYDSEEEIIDYDDPSATMITKTLIRF